MLRPCAGMPGRPCSRLGPGTRCSEHAREWKALRNADRAIAAAVVAESPACAVCGHTGSADNPLQADHVVPLIRSGRNNGKRQTLCRIHNRAKGAR
jgi:5-methylcytosine-specific restriction endonuclease McrA